MVEPLKCLGFAQRAAEQGHTNCIIAPDLRIKLLFWRNLVRQPSTHRLQSHPSQQCHNRWALRNVQPDGKTLLGGILQQCECDVQRLQALCLRDRLLPCHLNAGIRWLRAVECSIERCDECACPWPQLDEWLSGIDRLWISHHLNQLLG
jgi:hypothetical protein